MTLQLMLKWIWCWCGGYIKWCRWWEVMMMPEKEQKMRTQFFKFLDFSDSKVLQRPNMCYIFEKHGVQGYQILHSCVSDVKCTNTQKDPTCAIFLKSWWFKDFNYDHHIIISIWRSVQLSYGRHFFCPIFSCHLAGVEQLCSLTSSWLKNS